MIMVMLVLVMVALSALSASRSTFFNESATSNEADYARAMAAAEALIRDAQMDITGTGIAVAPTNCGNTMLNMIGCRVNIGGVQTLANPFFPEDNQDAMDLVAALAVQPIPCTQGICAPTAWPANALPNNFWLNNLAANTPNAARYGQFTGANPAATGNPILTLAPQQAWYWTELIPFDVPACAMLPGQCANGPSPTRPFIYRITAVARGMRANTLAVIQTYFVPDPKPT